MTIRLHAMTCGYLTLPFGFLVEGQEGQISVPVPSYLIEHPKGRVVFDTGLTPLLLSDDKDVQDRELGPLAGHTAVGFRAGEDVASRLRTLDCDPERIDFLVSSHLHFDHVGGNCLVPNARWVVQKREWAAACSPECQHRNHFSPAHYDLGHDRIEADGEYDLFGDDSVVCIPTFGHTPGHQSLRIKLAGGTVVLTADACYMRLSLERMLLPPGFLDDAAAMRTTFERFRALRDSGTQLIYGHDPGLWRELEIESARELSFAAIRDASARLAAAS